jgi:histone arginine demethylase JMJD6
MHVDPHATHAWNVLLTGCKRWALLPPTTPPEVAAPDPAAPASAWFAIQLPRVVAAGVEVVQFEQGAGETVCIPAGWWHAAMTVGGEVSVGVTANFLCRAAFEERLAALAASAPAAAAAWAARVRAAGLPFSVEGL